MRACSSEVFRSSQSGKREVMIKKGACAFPFVKARTPVKLHKHQRVPLLKSALLKSTARPSRGGQQRSRVRFKTYSSSLPSESFEKLEKFMLEKLKLEKLNSESDMFFLNCSYHSLEKFEFLK